MAYLLVDVLEFHILARLTAKDIGRCRTVCKEWYSFLSTPKFARLHLGATLSLAKNVVLATPEQQHSDAVATFIYDGTIFYYDKLIDIPFDVHPFEFITIGSLDGMLCVCLKNNSRMSIWNPLTGSKRDLPTSNDNGFFEAACDAFAFYLDSSNEYKCLHVKRGVRESVCIYSTRSNSWRELMVVKDVVFHNKNDKWSLGTLCRGGIYFTVGEFCSAFVRLIVRFDVNLETFTNVGLPSFSYEAGWHGALVNVDDHLHLFAIYYSSFNYSVDMWRMECEEWTKLLYVPQIDFIPMLPNFYVIHVKSTAMLLMMTEWGGRL